MVKTENEELDLNVRCRACLAELPEMHYLYGEVDTGLKLSDIVETTTTYQLSEIDGMSPYLCEKCTKTVVDFYNFKLLYYENDKYIKSLLNVVKKEHEPEHVIKNEENDLEIINSDLQSENVTREFVTHEDLFKGDIEENETGQFPIQNELVEIKEYVKYHCEKCNEWFFVVSSFSQHMKDFHGEENVDCESHCKKTLIKVPIVKIEEEEDELRRYDIFTINDGNIYACAECEKGFDNEADLKSHANSHKNYVCEQCGAAFSKKSHLNDHKEKHTAILRYRCQFCNKCFRRRTVLVKHRKLHTHPRQVICEVCGQRFNDKGTMSTHYKLKHVGARNFKCAVCGLAFPLKSTLEKHVNRRHEGNREPVHECDKCTMAYKDRSSLNRHKLNKHSVVPLPKPQCLKCNKTYTSVSNLMKHVRKIHDGDGELVAKELSM